MNNIIKTIVIGVIATLIYELSKCFFFFVVDKIKIKSLLFSLSGYWCSYVEDKANNSTEKYEAYELIKLKYKKETIFVKIYQLTNDGRKNCYVGIGFLRGDKLVYSYKEVHRITSNQVGTIILRYSNLTEHNLFLVGNYHEFHQNNYRSSSNPYILKRYNINIIDIIKINLFGNKYIFSLMHERNFKNECENMPKMR